MNIKEQLRKIAPAYLDEEVINQSYAHGTLHKVKKNNFLATSGVVRNEVFLILKGSFVQRVTTNDGREVTTMFHTESFLPFMICADSYSQNTHTEYSLIASEDSWVLEYSFDFIHTYVKTNHSCAMFYIEYLSNAYFTNEIFKKKALTSTAEQFLRWLYAEYPFLFQKFKSADIASLLGITPEWFSKLKKKCIS